MLCPKILRPGAPHPKMFYPKPLHPNRFIPKRPVPNAPTQNTPSQNAPSQNVSFQNVLSQNTPSQIFHPEPLHPDVLRPKTLHPKMLHPKPLRPKYSIRNAPSQTALSQISPSQMLHPQPLRPKPLHPKRLRPKTLRPKCSVPNLPVPPRPPIPSLISRLRSTKPPVRRVPPPPSHSLTASPRGSGWVFCALLRCRRRIRTPFYSGAGQPAPPERDSALGTGRGAPRTASVSAGGAPSGCGRRHFIIRERGQSAASPNRRRAPADAVPTTSPPRPPRCRCTPPSVAPRGRVGCPCPCTAP